MSGRATATELSAWPSQLYPCWISVSLQVVFFSLCSSSVSFSKLFISTFSLHLSSPHWRLCSAPVSACEASLFLPFLSFLSISWILSSHPKWLPTANLHLYPNTETNTIYRPSEAWLDKCNVANVDVMSYSGFFCVLWCVYSCLISHFLPALTFLLDSISPMLSSKLLSNWLKRFPGWVRANPNPLPWSMWPEAQFRWKLCCTLKRGCEWFIVIDALCQRGAPAPYDQLTPSSCLQEVINSTDSVPQRGREHGCTWCQEGFIPHTYTRLMETVAGCEEERKPAFTLGEQFCGFLEHKPLIWRHQRAAFFSLSRTICVLPAVILGLPRRPSFTWVWSLCFCPLLRFHMCIKADSRTDQFHILGWCGTAAVF